MEDVGVIFITSACVKVSSPNPIDFHFPQLFWFGLTKMSTSIGLHVEYINLLYHIHILI